ncbi:bifunctional hydroxymethylpyrimidine kinase/phosphomethylpyrimidine kinase [Streptococcus sp. H31]|uniref:bifunctional hydroxymethylpyrimidine kinase/phosphomethylpyrimidine kinase n=1 Tax=Streptococcus huangxiaojuni TaxID=3237239 RepID=UPI0034A4F28D
MKNNYILTIAGSDILSGGGLQADLATFSQYCLFAFVAQTCMTSVEEGQLEVIPTDLTVFKKQLKSLADIPFSVIKIGLLPTEEIAAAVLDFIKQQAPAKIVLDPVLVFKENSDKEVADMRDILRDFFPYVTAVTPNLHEAEILSGQSIRNLADMQNAAYFLYQLGIENVVIKGGTRLASPLATDIVYDGENMQEFSTPLLNHNNNGAGCTFAASIAAQLAFGSNLPEAVKKAKAFVYHAITHANEYGVVPYYGEK